MAFIVVLEAAGQFIGLFLILAVLAEFLDSRDPSRRG